MYHYLPAATLDANGTSLSFLPQGATPEMLVGIIGVNLAVGANGNLTGTALSVLD